MSDSDEEALTKKNIFPPGFEPEKWRRELVDHAIENHLKDLVPDDFDRNQLCFPIGGLYCGGSCWIPLKDGRECSFGWTHIPKEQVYYTIEKDGTIAEGTKEILLTCPVLRVFIH